MWLCFVIQSSRGCRRYFNSDEPVETIRVAYLQFRKGYNCALAFRFWFLWLFDLKKWMWKTAGLLWAAPFWLQWNRTTESFHTELWNKANYVGQSIRNTTSLSIWPLQNFITRVTLGFAIFNFSNQGPIDWIYFQSDYFSDGNGPQTLFSSVARFYVT